MATEKQLEANKKNAEKCTGPTTQEGKAISSQNALKHGLDAKTEVLRCESEETYEALIAEFYARYHPTVPEERALVNMMIHSEWMERRYACIDAGVWERGFYDTGTESLGLVFEKSQNAFDKVCRRINSAQRNFQRALKQLRELQSQSDQPSRDRKEAVLKIPKPNKPLTPELVSFRTSETPVPPTAPKTEEEPPIAA